ncbi:tRNA (adenosine(37)-N6)-threonylcarbamoyltransferase complex ATPase subunit type 1 TsaE [Candidatus Saccharibacteria bacterium]|nr:tRNA (adenosine(37)-N6)-threonylcarbamoyltransferase complex ATPase subunit type 1 TsaE [Candidatus Saccharibacteria bacterium]
MWQIESSSSDATYAIGERFGNLCRGGEVFVLSSDLGGGKTTFTKGLAAGAGCKDIVGSPSFTINRIYPCTNNRTLYHFDFYRLGDAGIVGQELKEALEEPGSIVVIEWADIVKDLLPKRSINIVFERIADNENARQLSIEYPEGMSYLITRTKK